MNNIDEILESYFLEIYKELRKKCTTYSNLNKEIKKYVQEVSFRNCELGAYVKKELFEMYDKEIGDIPIHEIPPNSN